MLLHADEDRAALRAASVIHLDVAPAELRKLFPGRTRLGLILGPRGRPWEGNSPAAVASREGFTLVTVPCQGQEELLAAFDSLARQTDFVLALPDSLLYNAATVKPLIISSLEKRIPILGFSLSFVRAGAAAGFYADFGGVGVQAAEAARRILAGEPAPARRCPARRRGGGEPASASTARAGVEGAGEERLVIVR
jgi:ABC-type uncharacterized transport system substrate-binding protein